MEPVKITIEDLENKIEDLILGHANVTTIAGPVKMRRVVNAAARWLDEHSKWGFLGPLAMAAEGLDGPGYRKLCWLLAPIIYRAAKKRGAV